MYFIDSWGYVSIVIIIVIIAFMTDSTVHLTKRMKKSGKWKMDYDKLALNMVAGMIIMSFLPGSLGVILKHQPLLLFGFCCQLFSVAKPEEKLVE